MRPTMLLLVVVLLLVSCAPPATPALRQTSTPGPQASTPTFTPKPPTPTFTPGPPTSTPTPTPGIGSTWTSPMDKMEMVYVPAGSFLMGSSDADPLATSEEKPQHSVTLDAFWIDRTEVTQRMYRLCVDAHACGEPTIIDSATRFPYWGDPEGRYEIYPVIHVNWNMAQTYCEWAGRRLPTEAEWEKAARGTDGRLYPWGNDPPNHDLANYDSYFGDTLNVGRYPKGASPYGAVDMAGNVDEWVSDWYSATYYEDSPAANPTGPDSGEKKVLRGGNWYQSKYNGSADLLRAAQRGRFLPAMPAFPDDQVGLASAFDNIGFRCARAP